MPEFARRYWLILEKMGVDASSGFLCPFTLDSIDWNGDLCRAHIIPKNTLPAPAQYVLQRAAYDHYFGRTLDIHLKDTVKFVSSDPLDRICASRNIVVVPPAGQSDDAKPLKIHPTSRSKAQQAAKKGRSHCIFSPDDGVPAYFLLEGNLSQLPATIDPAGNLKIGIRTRNRQPEIVLTHAAMLRIAALTFFRISPEMFLRNHFRGTLCSRFNYAFRKQLALRDLPSLFRKFEGCTKYISGAPPEGPEYASLDSLAGNRVMFHSFGGPIPHGVPFGISVFIRNDAGHVASVMIPWCCSPTRTLKMRAWNCYQRYLVDPSSVPDHYSVVVDVLDCRLKIYSRFGQDPESMSGEVAFVN